MHPIVLLSLYLALTLTSLGLAFALGLPPHSFWDELASGLGLTALVVLLVEFVLSGRFPIISRRIGMDVTMRLHQLVRFAMLDRPRIDRHAAHRRVVDVLLRELEGVELSMALMCVKVMNSHESPPSQRST